MHALGKFGEHSLRKLEMLSRFSRALQTSRVHPELDIRTLSMDQFFTTLLKMRYCSLFPSN